MPQHTPSERRKRSVQARRLLSVPSSPKAKRKIAKVMREFSAGTLESSSGAKVTGRKQAVAIALSEGRRA